MSHASQDRDVYDDELDRRRCVADAKSTGNRCKRRPIPGGRVCKIHGGGSPQAKRSARQRLLAAVEPAMARLVETVDQPVGEWQQLEPGSDKGTGVWKIVGPTFAEQRAAAEAILDRTGYPRRAEVSIADGVAELEAVLDELEDDDE